METKENRDLRLQFLPIQIEIGRINDSIKPEFEELV